MQIVYPASLPSPTAAPLQPAERRLLSELPGPTGARGLQRDWLATQRVEFVLSQAQAGIWRDWWRNDLTMGGAWFAAEWPGPAGWHAVSVRRFVGEPSWALIPGYGWRVFGECEVRGRGELPRIIIDPLFDQVQLLLHFNGEDAGTVFDDSSKYHRGVSAGSGVTTSRSLSKFGHSSGSFPGTDVGRLSVDGISIPDGVDSCVEVYVYPVSGTNGQVIWSFDKEQPYCYLAINTDDAGNVKFGTNFLGRSLNEDGWPHSPAQWYHVAVTRSAGRLRLFVDGILVREAGPHEIDVDGVTDAPLLIGADPTGIGHGFGGYLDDLRVTVGDARYVAEFDPPGAPFPDR